MFGRSYYEHTVCNLRVDLVMWVFKSFAIDWREDRLANEEKKNPAKASGSISRILDFWHLTQPDNLVIHISKDLFVVPQVSS